jgi:hypothetical protein
MYKKILLSMVPFLLKPMEKSLDSGQQYDPSQWEVHVKKFADKKYEIQYKVIINKPWHLYSQNNAEGIGQPTTFTINKNPLLKRKEELAEKGELKKVKEETLGTIDKYYENTVTFIDTVSLVGDIKTNLIGKVGYMLCQDGKCLPPAERPIAITLDNKNDEMNKIMKKGLN